MAFLRTPLQVVDNKKDVNWLWLSEQTRIQPLSLTQRKTIASRAIWKHSQNLLDKCKRKASKKVYMFDVVAVFVFVVIALTSGQIENSDFDYSSRDAAATANDYSHRQRRCKLWELILFFQLFVG